MSGLFADILDAALVKTGSGPVRSVSRASRTLKLDQSGQFSVTASGVDPGVSAVLAKRIAQLTGLLGTPAAKVFTSYASGVVDKIVTSADVETGEVTLTFSGDDLLSELANTSVLNTELSNGTGGATTIGAALTTIMAFVPAWTIDTTTYTDTAAKPNAIYLKLAGESVLTALNKVAAATGRHFRLGVNRQIVWLWDAQPSSGLRVISAGDATLIDNDEVALIQKSLDITSDTHEIVTRLYPFGGGNAAARKTLNNATDAAPAGYTRSIDALHPEKSYIQHTAAVALYGVIERVMSFKDASPAGTSTAATETASTGNQIQAQAVEYLRTHTAPLKTYRFSLSKLDRAVYPGQTIRLIFRRTVDGYRAIDEDVTLVVLDSTLNWDTNGNVRTTGMTVATTDRRPTSDVGTLVGMMSTVASLDAHSQQAESALTADTAGGLNATALSTANTFSALQTLTGGLFANGILRLKTANVTSTATIAASNVIVRVTGGGAKTLTLPSANQSGQIILVVDEAQTAGASNITMAAPAGQTLVGSTVINTNGGFMLLYSTGGTTWCARSF